jgi:hypothetical protein
MRRIILTITVLALFLSLEFCVQVHPVVSPAFGDKTSGHRIIAVLPFKMVFTGKKPKKMTEERQAKIEEVESVAFQKSFYNMLMHESDYSRHPIRVEIQPITTTNRILEDEGIGIRQTWDMSAQELADILGVDAVVRTRVEKRRYMSDGVSLGIEIGTAILDALFDDDHGGFPLGVSMPTNKINAGCAVINGRDGSTLWSYALSDETDWRLPAESIIEHITVYFAKNFPYR